ncbi:class I mannose-6-phosphate isomerase (plasmid) [Deinococcus taeanensis]|uniref:type I phosphomannose isomerase catalytic subunit n=1 Tax=Deinococcus taeanensis TaxID=2737050 RepID=UPI001CDC8DF1|nr:type I phosphomannose isomerase catalytic subunit [Deinococcus taeanensis]UBV44983.1 class I mannose-6-phosphate isomerase [Deinococcus taeanensis]
MTQSSLPAVLPLVPRYHARVWGGEQLAPPVNGTPVGEAWIADGQSVIASGPHAGQTVNALLHAAPQALLGPALAPGEGFPLLIKLLDCRDWLSVQVHPNDEQARAMVGPGERGKTEAWHFLRVEPDATLLAGVTPGTAPEALAHAIRAGNVLNLTERHRPQVGDTLFIPAGTLHALGPGLLLYEVQQASDTTYRVYDWDRPASAGRTLHLDESVQVTRADRRAQWRRAGETGGLGELVRCGPFTLEGARGGTTLPGGPSFALITVVDGELTLDADGQSLTLGLYGTALLPASASPVTLRGAGRALVARPGDGAPD